jgi:hypothetical protein
MIAIQVKYLGPTIHRGSRIKAYTCNGHQLTIPYDYSLGDIDLYAKAATMLAKRLDWQGALIGGGTKEGYTFVFSDSDQYKI